KNDAIPLREEIQTCPPLPCRVTRNSAWNTILDEVCKVVEDLLDQLRITARTGKQLLELIEQQNRSEEEVRFAPDLQIFTMQVFPQSFVAVRRWVLDVTVMELVCETLHRLLQHGLFDGIGKIQPHMDRKIVVGSQQRKQPGLQQRGFTQPGFPIHNSQRRQ